MGLNLFAKVSLDGSGYEAGLKRIEAGAESVGHSLKHFALEAFGIYTVQQAVTKSIEAGERLVDLSRRLGVGIEALQEFGFAARQNGADVEALTGFIEKLNSAMLDPKKFASFEKLGISEGDLKSKRVEELIMMISANARGRSSQELIAPIRDVGGRGAGQLIPMLKEDMADLREEAHTLGQVMRMEDAVALKFLADQMKSLSQMIIVGLAPSLVILMEKVLRLKNVIMANGTFWGDVAAKTSAHDWAFGLLGVLGLKPRPGSESEAATKRLNAAFTESGAKSDAALSELNDITDAEFKALKERQKLIEQINSVPDFSEDETVKKKQKKAGGFHLRGIEGDSLARVGNFLGHNVDGMQRLALDANTYLKRIAENTAPARNTATGSNNWRSTWEDEEFPPN